MPRKPRSTPRRKHLTSVSAAAGCGYRVAAKRSAQLSGLKGVTVVRPVVGHVASACFAA